MDYAVDFDALPWALASAGGREKKHRVGQRVLRLVEYDQALVPHWCEKGHIGHIVCGTLELEFAGQTLTLSAGSALFIPPGRAHAHRAVPKTATVRALFVEDAD